MLAVIEELKQTERYSASALDRIAAAVRADRDRARGHLVSKRAVNELARLGGKLEKIARLLEEEDATPRQREASARSRRWVLEARAARRAAALSSAMTDAGAFYQPDRLHEVRIAAKKLRYALEVSADVAGVKSSPDLRLLRRTQDTLGRLHDLQMLVNRVRQLQASLTVPDVTAWRQLDTLVISLEDECRRLHGRYMKDREALATLAARFTGVRERESRGRAKHSK
jgi:CHAD domain-containing protein